jgi:hypothetical protein
MIRKGIGMDQQFLFGDAEPEREFELPNGGSITLSKLRRAKHDIQVAVMRKWFYANFEDPAESTPYDSAEGGYQYIWGGPFDAHEELEGEFGGIVPDEVIKELADELSAIAFYWSGNSSASDSSFQFDDYLFRLSPDSYVGAFNNSTLNIRRLLETKVGTADAQLFLRLLYVNVITALETYLSDKFISSITADRTLLRKFVETTPDFQSEKIPLSDIFKASEEIDQKVKAYLSEVVWHRLDRIKSMFRDTLGTEFPSDLRGLFKAIIVRHDFVHRNGKTKDGTEHVLDEDDIKKLLEMAESFVSCVESQQTGATPPSSAPPEF